MKNLSKAFYNEFKPLEQDDIIVNTERDTMIGVMFLTGTETKYPAPHEPFTEPKKVQKMAVILTPLS